MALLFSETSTKVELPAVALDTSISDSGDLISVGLAGSSKCSVIQVYNARNGQVLAELGKDYSNCHSVSFINEYSLYCLLEDNIGDRKLCLTNWQKGTLVEVASYGLSENCYKLTIDASKRLLAVLGNAIEVWDLEAQAVVRFIEGADSSQRVCASFSSDASILYAYGIEPSKISAIRMQDGQVVSSLPAPKPFGQQLLVSPSDRFCLAVGEGVEGVYLYDLKGRERLNTDFYNKTTLVPGPFAFSPDSSLLISCAAGWIAEGVTTDEYISGPDLPTGKQSALSANLKAPLFAVAYFDNTLSWVSLEEAV